MAMNSKLPIQRADVTFDQMARIRVRLAHLSAYIFGVSNDGTITLGYFKTPTICVTLPPPTALDESVDAARLEKAIAAVEALNRAIDNDDDQPYAQPRMACLDPNTWHVDMALTESSTQQPAGAPAAVWPPDNLRPLGPEQIKLLIAGLRQDVADLSKYIDKIGEGKAGQMFYLFDYVLGKISDLGEPTPLAGPIADRGRFGQALDAIKLMNAGFDNGGVVWDKTPA